MWSAREPSDAWHNVFTDVIRPILRVYIMYFPVHCAGVSNSLPADFTTTHNSVSTQNNMVFLIETTAHCDFLWVVSLTYLLNVFPRYILSALPWRYIVDIGVWDLAEPAIKDYRLVLSVVDESRAFTAVINYLQCSSCSSCWCVNNNNNQCRTKGVLQHRRPQFWGGSRQFLTVQSQTDSHYCSW